MKKTVNKKLVFILGLILLTVIYIPVLIQNRNMYVLINDQLDGELLTYILQAKHIGDVSFPEMMNGAPKSAMTMAAPLFIAFFYFFEAGAALFISLIIVALTAYTGMFLCVLEWLDQELIAVFAAIIFAMLPFYPVYGLCSMGQPLLLYAFFMLWKRKRTALSFFIIAVFTAASSPVLVGFADVCFFGILSLAGLYKRKNVKYVIGGVVEMILLYCLFNIDLLKSVFLSTGENVTHKSEIVVLKYRFIVTFFETMHENYKHAPIVNACIIYAAIAVLMISCVTARKVNVSEQEKKCRRFMTVLVCMYIGNAVFAAFWKSYPVADWRNSIGGLLCSFQITRVIWLNPAIDYLVLAGVMYLSFHIARRAADHVLNNRKISNYTGYVISAAVIVISFMIGWNGSLIKVNRDFAVGEDHSRAMYETVDTFYQPEMFAEIRNDIGQSQSEYRVISVGLYPSIAQYNGFYCLDAYSNNYTLKYKHQFRQVIAEELEKDETLQIYYDEWGNRCYAFSAEIPKRNYIPKREDVTIDYLDYDYDVLKSMGCQYIFSSVKISEENPVRLFGDYSSGTSRYRVYVYELL